MRKARAFPRSYKFFRPERASSEHWVYFTYGSLRRLLHACGFEDVRSGRARYLRRAVASGRRGRMIEALRWGAASLVRAAHALTPGLGKEIVAVARKPLDSAGSADLLQPLFL